MAKVAIIAAMAASLTFHYAGAEENPLTGVWQGLQEAGDRVMQFTFNADSVVAVNDLAAISQAQPVPVRYDVRPHYVMMMPATKSDRPPLVFEIVDRNSAFLIDAPATPNQTEHRLPMFRILTIGVEGLRECEAMARLGDSKTERDCLGDYGERIGAMHAIQNLIDMAAKGNPNTYFANSPLEFFCEEVFNISLGQIAGDELEELAEAYGTLNTIKAGTGTPSESFLDKVNDACQTQLHHFLPHQSQ